MLSPRLASLSLLPFFLALITTCTAASQTTSYPASASNTITLRIEGDNTTYFEGLIKSGPRNISLKDTAFGLGPLPRPCDGLNNGANPSPTNTPTDALDAAAKLVPFSYDGDYDDDISDYYITRIATSDANAFNNKFWGALVNYKVSAHPEGLTLSGCQQAVGAGDEVLWAFITTPPGTDDTKSILFLKLAPVVVKVGKGKGFVVTVTDGRTGKAVAGASVDGVHTGADGKATLYLFNSGFFQYKAHLTGNVRSNVMNVTVTG